MKASRSFPNSMAVARWIASRARSEGSNGVATARSRIAAENGIRCSPSLIALARSSSSPPPSRRAVHPSSTTTISLAIGTGHCAKASTNASLSGSGRISLTSADASRYAAVSCPGPSPARRTPAWDLGDRACRGAGQQPTGLPWLALRHGVRPVCGVTRPRYRVRRAPNVLREARALGPAPRPSGSPAARATSASDRGRARDPGPGPLRGDGGWWACQKCSTKVYQSDPDR